MSNRLPSPSHWPKPQAPCHPHSPQDEPSWSTTATSYDRHLLAASLQGSRALVATVAKRRPLTTTSRALDLGAGTGSATRALRENHPTAPILAVDRAPGMLDVLRAQNLPFVTVAQADATTLATDIENNSSPVPHGSFSHAVAALVVQFVGSSTQQASLCAALFHAVGPGGVAGISLSYDVTMAEPWHLACEALDPTYRRVPVHGPGIWASLAEAEAGMRAAGFVDVRGGEIWADLGMSAEEYVEWWFEGRHPVFAGHVRAWEGKVEDVKPVLERVLREKYHGGRMEEVGLRVGFVVGVKPEEEGEAARL